MRIFRLTPETKSETCKISCGSGTFDRLSADGEVFVFTDSNVHEIYAEKLDKKFAGAPKYVMPAGEEHKTADTLFALLSEMAAANLHRNATIVCIGGGVVGDIGGLASALYMRGISCIQVPTTLLAQVDSSVGGKTAIDFCGVKNLVGAFRQPERVIVDPQFLKTLPIREIRCGLGEIIKHAALDGALFDKLVANEDKLFDLDFLADLVPENIAIKAEIVQKDPHETGARKCLNLGHTTGHAFELAEGKLSHGEYVLAGLLYESELAKRRTVCDEKYLSVLKRLIEKVLGRFPELPDPGEAAELARLDKKNTASDSVTFAAPVAKGKYGLFKIPFDEYVKELREIRRNNILKLAVVGKDVSQSLSPAMHTFILRSMGRECVYDKISIPPAEFENRAESLFSEYDGLNITIPYKSEILPRLNDLRGDAPSFGAVNFVLTKERAGYNTDGYGFLLMLENEAIPLKGKSVLVLGAGGAGRSCVKKLTEAGADVFVYERDGERLNRVLEEIGGFTPLYDIPLQPFDTVLNCTGVGMHDTVGKSPVGSDLLAMCEVAVDLIYVPEESEFLRLAKAAGKRTVNGAAMLFYQAYMADCILLGRSPDAEEAKELFQSFTEAGR